jgi:ribonuclease HI
MGGIRYATRIEDGATRGKKAPRNGRTTVSRHLAKVHRQALTCLGPMRTTATDILEAHANIPPLHILIDKIRLRALIRMTTFPNTHPLHLHIIRAHGKMPKRHPTPLHHLFASFPTVNPKTMETIHPIRRDPKAALAADTLIPSPENSNAHRAIHPSDITIYTDGSAKEGGVGAAAVMIKRASPSRPRKLLYHLGRGTKYTVYSAETTGLLLGAHLLRSVTSHFTSVTFATDNQAAILALDTNKPGPSHIILDAFESLIRRLRDELGRLDITVQWVPGHQGIQGNEAADQAAKEAAEGASSRSRALPKMLKKPLPVSKAATKLTHSRKLHDRATKWWRASPRYSKASRIDPSMPSNNFMQEIKDLPRLHSSILLQLRTGHAPLNYFLHKIGQADSPTCLKCRHEDETVIHYLVRCPFYDHFRLRFFYPLGRGASQLPFLLTDKKAMKQVVKFALATKRFLHTPAPRAAPPETVPTHTDRTP